VGKRKGGPRNFIDQGESIRRRKRGASQNEREKERLLLKKKKKGPKRTSAINKFARKKRQWVEKTIRRPRTGGEKGKSQEKKGAARATIRKKGEGKWKKEPRRGGKRKSSKKKGKKTKDQDMGEPMSQKLGTESPKKKKSELDLERGRGGCRAQRKKSVAQGGRGHCE